MGFNGNEIMGYIYMYNPAQLASGFMSQAYGESPS